MEIHQKISMPNYEKMKTMVRRSIDQKLRLRNFDARHGKIETGAVVKSRKGSSGVEGGKGICYQLKQKGQSSKGDQCSFQHESDDHAPKPTPKAAPPSQPSMTRGRCVSHWCQEGKVQLGQRHGWHGTIVLYCSHRTSTCFCSPSISKILVCEGLEPKWLRRQTETPRQEESDAQHAESSVPSFLCTERDAQHDDSTSVASVADKEVSVPLQVTVFPWQAEYPMFQNRARLTHKLYLSMNSRPRTSRATARHMSTALFFGRRIISLWECSTSQDGLA